MAHHVEIQLSAALEALAMVDNVFLTVTRIRLLLVDRRFHYLVMRQIFVMEAVIV
jgi:hypothetical protein